MGTNASDSDRWLTLDRQLCFALYAASLAMTKLYKPLLAPLGITYPQYLVMLVLWERDGLTVSQLGERLALDSGTLTPLLKRLEAAGLVQRVRDTADERRVMLSLSSAGQALKSRASKLPETVACATGCELGELAALTARLNALRLQISTPTSAWPERRAQPLANTEGNDMAIDKAVSTATATATGGRTGTAKSSDDRLNVNLSTPKELGGDSGPGTNPEQLFAAGYSACFIGAMKAVAARQKIRLPAEVSITSEVSIGAMTGKPGAFSIGVAMAITVPGMERAAAEALVAAAHEVCPYSNATRGNIEVTLTVV